MELVTTRGPRVADHDKCPYQYLTQLFTLSRGTFDDSLIVGLVALPTSFFHPRSGVFAILETWVALVPILAFCSCQKPWYAPIHLRHSNARAVADLFCGADTHRHYLERLYK